MNAHGIDVFHAADGNGVVSSVTHDFELNFLVALNGFFHQDLMDRGELECVQTDFNQFFLIVGKAAAGTAQGECRTQYDGITDPFGSLFGFVQGVGNLGGNDRLTNGLAELLEHFPVLGTLDRCTGRTQQFHPAFLQNALFLQLHSQIQAGLTTDTGNDGIGTLVADDFRHIFQGQRFHIDLVGNGGVGHNGGGIGIDQNHLITFFPQGKTSLCAGVVKFRGLADDNRAGADDHDFLDICTLCHKKASITRLNIICRFSLSLTKPVYRRRQ